MRLRPRWVLWLLGGIFLATGTQADPLPQSTGLLGEPEPMHTAESGAPGTPLPWVVSARGTGTGFGHEIATAWAKIRVGTKGVQEIRGSDLASAGFDLNAFDPRAFRLFVRPGLPLLPENESDSGVGLAEVAMRVDGADDGRFDPDDRILFWGLAASGWVDEYGVVGASPTEWLDHPYESHNTYWLALDPTIAGAPARWGTRNVAPSGSAAPVDTFRARLHFEEDREYVTSTYQRDLVWDRWIARRLLSGTPATILSADLDGIVPAVPARLRARFWGLSSPGTHTLSVDLNDTPAGRLSWAGQVRSDLDTTGTWLVDGANRLSLSLAPLQTSLDQVSFHYWELQFARRFLAAWDSLEFAEPSDAGPHAFTLAGFSTDTTDSFALLDVSDPLAPILLVGAASFDSIGGRGLRFQDDRSGAHVFAAAAPAWHRPELTRETIRDVRHGGAGYLVICVDEMSGNAEALAEHRRKYPPFPGATAGVVRLSDIYAAYSGGRLDPTAIRNFLFDAVAAGGWSPAPSYVCLMGDATFDHADRSGIEPSGTGARRLPTHEAPFAGESIENDAWFGDFDVAADSPELGDIPEIAIGRLPFRDLQAAILCLNKIIRADLGTSAESGGNRLLWAVDDASQRTAPDPLGGAFTQNAEELDREHVPGWVERRKVNLLEHPLTADGTKPSGRDSLVAELRRGAAVWYYVGRGGAFKMADENLFTVDDVNAIAYLPRLPFLVATTSGVGVFSSPFRAYLAESLVLVPNGGVLGAFAAGANTFAFANLTLGQSLLDAMFAPPAPGTPPGAGPTLGAVALGAARGAFALANNRGYNLLGDPGSRLSYPGRDVRIRLYDDVTGVALADSLPRGRRIRVEGEVLDGRGDGAKIDSGHRGIVDVTVTDAPPLHSYPTFPGAAPGVYEGNPVFVSEAPGKTTWGEILARFVVPISAKAGNGGRVQAIAWNPSESASGAVRIAIGGPQPDPADVTGPTITFSFLGGHSIVIPGEPFYVELADPSGIQFASSAPERAVTIQFDELPPMQVSDLRPIEVSGMPGASYYGNLPNLTEGEHVVRFAASDELDDPLSGAAGVHRSELVVPFTVAPYLATRATDGRALPNPFTPESGTVLVLRAPGFLGSARIEIHDVRGRRVRTMAGTSIYPIEMKWDGRDDNGRALAAGIYPWRATVTNVNRSGTPASFSGRLVLLR